MQGGLGRRRRQDALVVTGVLAIELLARGLHWKMEHRDPTEDGDWDSLADSQRDFYRTCVRALVGQQDWIVAAMG